MKTFGKVLLGVGTFAAGMYAGAFISAFVAEKVMDSPLDESVLRKHAGHKNESKLNYMVFEKPKNWDNPKAAEEEFKDWVEDDYGDNDPVIADYKGSVKTFDDLPKAPEIGDYFFVEDADNGKGCIYIYTKNGYAIPEVTDGVSLNDIFSFKKDAPQEDTDDTVSDTVPTYYESLKLFLDDERTASMPLKLFLDDERTASMPWGTAVRIKMKDGVVLQYKRTNDGWVLDSAEPDPNHISGIFYGSISLVNFNHYNFYEGDLILNIPFVEDASEKAKLYKWHNGEITDTGIMIDRSDEDDTAAEESNS